MKKILLSFLIIALVLTSCSKPIAKENTVKEETLTCTKTETDEEGYNITDTIVLTSKNDLVIKATETTISEMDKNMIDITLSFGEEFVKEFNEIEGMEAAYSKESEHSIKYTISIDYTKIDLNKLKEIFKNDFTKNNFYTSKNQTLEEFKKENLSDYSCK